MLTNLRSGVSVTTVADATGAWFAILEAEPGDPVSIRATDAAGNTSESTATSVPDAPGDVLPPDPSTVAPPIDPTLAQTDLFEATKFLFEGPDPKIQTGVAPGAIALRTS